MIGRRGFIGGLLALAAAPFARKAEAPKGPSCTSDTLRELVSERWITGEQVPIVTEDALVDLVHRYRRRGLRIDRMEFSTKGYGQMLRTLLRGPRGYGANAIQDRDFDKVVWYVLGDRIDMAVNYGIPAGMVAVDWSAYHNDKASTRERTAKDSLS